MNKKWIAGIVFALCIAAGIVMTMLLHGGSEMDQLIGYWYHSENEFFEYLTLREDMTYTRHLLNYTANAEGSGEQKGIYQLDGNKIGIDVPEKGSISVYEVSFPDEDTMIWTKSGGTETTEFRRSQ